MKLQILNALAIKTIFFKYDIIMYFTSMLILYITTNINGFSLINQDKTNALETFVKTAIRDDENSRDVIQGQIVNDIQEHVETNWPLGIVSYYFDSDSYDYVISRRIRVAMNALESYSCVKFKPLILKPTEKMSWIHFTNPTGQRQCSHEPYILDSGEMVMVIGLDCLQRRDILHTLLHAIGLKDEVSHPQRDQYVRVLWENIYPEYRNLFRVKLDDMASKTLVEYDPLSIMHFQDHAFSRNGQATLSSMVPELMINPSNDLSQIDKMKLRLLFGHECNKRKVGDLLDTCKKALKINAINDKTKQQEHSSEQRADNTTAESKEKDANVKDASMINGAHEHNETVNINYTAKTNVLEENKKKYTLGETSNTTDEEYSEKSDHEEIKSNDKYFDSKKEHVTKTDNKTNNTKQQTENEINVKEETINNGGCVKPYKRDGKGGCI